MFTTTILSDIPNGNLILGFLPESLGMLIFGIVLIIFAVLLRRLFNRRKEETGGENYDERMR